ncbi:MAG: hypothetical protein JWP27_2262 [Flaviaesturariibacter sp.]|nr:hypothetical protein [Flaviaesturariibacter sp.]
MHRILVSVVLLLVALSSQAQRHRVKADLPAVGTTGFYRIDVTPALSAEANSDLSDVRIVDEGGRQAPYVLRQAMPSASVFHPFQVLSQVTDSSNTTVDLETVGSARIGEIFLVLANTAVERTAAVSGSTDRLHWFAIAEDVRLQTSVDTDPGSFGQLVRFPPVDYPYLRLQIRNGRKDPLNLLRAGVYEKPGSRIGSQFRDNPAPSFAQRDSSGRSTLSIRQNAPYRVDRLFLNVQGARYYQRPVRVYTVDRAGVRTLVATSLLRSGDSAGIELGGMKSEGLMVQVENGDSPPLSITAVRLAQRSTFLVAYLQTGRRYTLLAGLAGAHPPLYDLSAFADRIPTDVPLLVAGPFKETSTKQDAGRPFDPLWIALAIGLAALGFLTFRLLRDVKKASPMEGPDAHDQGS